MAAKRKKDDPGDEPTFEQDMERLEEIVERLESGELALEEAISLFDEGTKLGRRCGSRLEEAEKKITVLLEKADGTVEEREYVEGEGAPGSSSPTPTRSATSSPSSPSARGERRSGTRSSRQRSEAPSSDESLFDEEDDGSIPF